MRPKRVVAALARCAPPALPALTALAVMLGASSANASEARTSSLSWLRLPGSDSCIATQALARSVEERLGRHVFVSAADADVSVEGRIEKRVGAPGWHAVITIRDAKGALLGTRELDRPDTSCASMNDPLALVIAIMIDPEAKLSTSPTPLAPAPAPAPAPPPAPASAPAPAPAPALPEPKKDPLRFQGDALFTITTGLAPSLDPGLGVGGSLAIPKVPLTFRVYGSVFLPTTADRDGARATFDMIYGGGAVCPTLRRPAFVAMLCGGGHLGLLRSVPETANRTVDEKTALLWSAVGEGRMTIPLVAPLAITFGASAVLPLLRPTFEYTRSDGTTRDSLHRVSAIAFAADAGLGFYFP